MLLKTTRSVSSIEDLLLFYNKYFALENEDDYLICLVNNMAFSFGTSDISTFDEMPNYKEKLSNILYEDWLIFYAYNSININGIEIFIDGMGNIIQTSNEAYNKYKGQNIVDIFGLYPEIENMFLHNLLVSKIYKAVQTKLFYQYGSGKSLLFKSIFARYITYDYQFNQKFDMSIFPKPYSRTISKR